MQNYSQYKCLGIVFDINKQGSILIVITSLKEIHYLITCVNRLESITIG